MTTENKDLLLKDLCGRLPYGVKLYCNSNKMMCIGPYTLDTITLDRIFNKHTKYVQFDEVKPYLFPLSSMTEEQKIELTCIIDSDYAQIDWYNKNHFDYRGLIPMGLAIDTTGLNIY